MLRVIVNADDFGLTAGVNESIVACHRAGSVTSASLLPGLGAAGHAAQLAAANPDLGVGLHFNLTLGPPLADPRMVPSLLGPDGRFLARGGLLRRGLAGRVDPAHVAIELQAQLARMRELGVAPSHLDSHQHVHALPVVFAALAQAAVATRTPLRVPWRWRGRVAGKSLARRASELALAGLVRRCVARRPEGLASNDGFCSVFDLQRAPAAIDEACYSQLLAPYERGAVELMVHPAVVDADLTRLTAITAVSAAEDRLLRTDFLRRLVEARGGRLATYRDVG